MQENLTTLRSFLSLRTMPRCDSGLPHDTRNIVGTSGNVTCSRRSTASSSRFLRPGISGITMVLGREKRRELQNLSTPVPHFQSGSGSLNHTGGTCSHGGMIDYPRYPISEMHLGRSPDSMEIQRWKVNFKTEVCSKTADGSKKLR